MTIDEMLHNWSEGCIAHLRADNKRNMPRLKTQAIDLVRMGFDASELTVVERNGQLDVVPLVAIRRAK